MQKIFSLFNSALEKIPGANPELLDLTVATQLQFGDFQTNVAMQHAKTLRQSPQAIAKQIISLIPANDWVESVDVAGPGFINVRLKSQALGEAVAELQVDTHLGVRQSGAGKTVIVDFSSPNVAKTMHVAHLRSTIIGDAIRNLHRCVGYRVVADNHIGDWGTQFGKLLVAFKQSGTSLESATIQTLEELYQDFNRRAEENPDLENAARGELLALQQKQEPNYSLWKQFISISLNEFNQIYSRLGIQFDTTLGESFYNDSLAETVRILQDGGIVKESEGAQVAFFDNDLYPPMVVQKQDGAYLYSTTDLATVRYRVKTYNPHRIIYVTDSRQKLHFQQFFHLAAQVGWEANLEHVMFGLMKFSEGVVMSTRKGAVIPLRDLLDEAESRARAVLQNSDYPEPEKQAIARAVGIGAVKYQDLSQNPASDITFTWDKALNLQGNSAPYLQYAYSRVQGILRKCVEKQLDTGVDSAAIVPATEVERLLCLQLLQFPLVVERAALTCRPNLLCDLLYQLAATYQSFYSQVPVLREEDASRRLSCLRLSKAVAACLRSGLACLGIEVMERM